MDNRYRGKNDQQDDLGAYGRRTRQDEQFSASDSGQYGDSGWRTQADERWQSGINYDRGYGRNAPFGRDYADRSDSGYRSDTGSLDDYDRSATGGRSVYAQTDRDRYGANRFGGSRGDAGYGDRDYGRSTFDGGSGYQRGSIAPRQYDRDERGFFDRASDEVMSWFGDDDAARRRQLDAREDHRGKGPAGYTRSQERVLEDANERLMHDSAVDASNITVTCENGEVTLSGTVDTRHAKRRAEDIVENVSGVKHVQNNLRVQTGGTNYYSDTTTLTDS